MIIDLGNGETSRSDIKHATMSRDGCIGFHTSAAIHHGATRDEVLETVGVAIYMGGGPSYVYGAQALEAFDQLTES